MRGGLCDYKRPLLFFRLLPRNTHIGGATPSRFPEHSRAQSLGREIGWAHRSMSRVQFPGCMHTVLTARVLTAAAAGHGRGPWACDHEILTQKTMQGASRR